MCERIIEYVCSVSNKNALRYIPYYSLCERTGASAEEVLLAISYLSGINYPILNVKFELIEFEDSEPIQISNEDIIEARLTNTLIHPIKGIPVDNYKNKVFMYFCISDLGKEIIYE